MASTATGTAGATSKSKLISQWMIVIITITIAYVAVTRLIDVGKRVITPRPQATVDAVYAHCNEFIVLAQAKYADDWKFRLDPRDTVCAAQIQAEWERQSAERRTSSQTEHRPTFVEPNRSSSSADETPLDENASRARNPETYCLNMMSLARTRLGPEWKSKLTPEELAGCEAAVAASPN